MVSRKPILSEDNSTTLGSSRSSGVDDAVNASANEGSPTQLAPQSALDGQHQDAGDFVIRHLTLDPKSRHHIPYQDTASSTNPFHHGTSGSAAPILHNNGCSFWDDSHTAMPNDAQDDSPFSTSTSIPPLLDDLSDQEDAHGRPAKGLEVDHNHEAPLVLSATKGKAPLIDDGIIPISIPRADPTTRPDVETPRTKAGKQRNEVYQIKHIRWHDINAIENPRSSPILIQNANGPCPLLALVNALSLSIPAELITPFIDTLQTREQISLGLLLDAVFEELMSDRRGGHLPDLPDVGDLYAFLVTLHTGMNVNPRFVTDPLIPPSADEEEFMGTFESTREMKLYSTFQIPLIHGWIPHQHELAHQAFSRTAQTYEDAQNVQFQEEDLERRLQSGEITFEEQQLLGDLKTIGQFFTYWPTQLTARGLDVMKRCVKPGQIAILFRNDHFSMLYKEPRSQRLMTLVTDAGYATHEEIIWESLVDINGANGEWFSGDFRSVSHENPVGHDAFHEDGWTTVESKHGRKGKDFPGSMSGGEPGSHGSGNGAAATETFNHKAAADLLRPDGSDGGDGQRVRSASEQEDLDLALALQLQEEEEERLREQDTNRRRAHENKMSRDFIERQSSNIGAGGSTSTSGVHIPVRRSGPSPAPTTHRPENGDDAPPPYEQAASSRPYHPPRGHPSNELAPRQSSAYAQQAAAMGQVATESSSRRRMSARQSLAANQMPPGRPPTLQPRRGRIETGMNSANAGRDDKCNVM